MRRNVLFSARKEPHDGSLWDIVNLKLEGVILT